MHRTLFISAILVSALHIGCVEGDAPAQQDQHVEAAKASFEIFVGEDEQHYFRLVRADGEKLLRSEGYTTKAAALKGIAAVKRNGVAKIQYDVRQAEDGQYYFNLIATNGEIVGVSSRLFAKKAQAKSAVTNLTKIIAELTEAEPKISCYLKRTAEVPQGEGSVEVDATNLGDEDFASSESLEAFDGWYSYDVTLYEDSFDVLFYENKHVQDETGGLNCEVPTTLERGTTFCEEPIEIDASLGTDEDERMVHAFDFGCRID